MLIASFEALKLEQFDFPPKNCSRHRASKFGSKILKGILFALRQGVLNLVQMLLGTVLMKKKEKKRKKIVQLKQLFPTLSDKQRLNLIFEMRSVHQNRFSEK